MSAIRLLAELSAAGVVLWVDDCHRLGYDGSAEALTDSVLAQLGAHKAEMFELLALEPSPWWVRLALAGEDPGRPSHEVIAEIEARQAPAEAA